MENERSWDGHIDIAGNHRQFAGETDKPIAGLLDRPEAARPARLDAGDLGRRVRPAAGGAAAEEHQARAATTTRTPSRPGWPAAASRAACTTARPTRSATRPPSIASASTTCTRPSCTCSASITAADVPVQRPAIPPDRRGRQGDQDRSSPDFALFSFLMRQSPCDLLSLLLVSLLCSRRAAAEPFISGLQPGTASGAVFVPGLGRAQRGTSHCFICETADRPAVVVFARSPSDPLGRLVRGLDKALDDHKTAELRLGHVPARRSARPSIRSWSSGASRKRSATCRWACSRIRSGRRATGCTKDADVTVLLFVKQKVVANFAFRAGELTRGAGGRGAEDPAADFAGIEEVDSTGEE